MTNREGNEENASQTSATVPQIPSNIQRVVSRTIPGPVNTQHNKGALDWGWQGFLAYGAQTVVVVVDPVTLQYTQTLSKHRSHVVKVRWRKTHHYHQISAPYSLVLASADNSGCIIIWDVNNGEALATLQDGTKSVTEMEWLGKMDGSEHLLAALHPPYSLVIWDTRHNTKLWKKSYTETLLSFDFDPFHYNKMTFLCGGCVLFVDDFSLRKCPSSNGKKFYISTARNSPGRSTSGSLPSSASSSSLSDQEKTGNRLRKKMKDLVTIGEVKPKDDSIQLAECLQLVYHRTVRDQLLLLYPREVLVLDLAINQTVGNIAIERSMSPFVQIVSCCQRDVVFCLHETGAISGHFRRRQLPVVSTIDRERDAWIANDPALAAEQYYEVMYDKKCQSEHLRLNKASRPTGMAVNPVTEKDVALVLGDGRVAFKEIMRSHKAVIPLERTPLFTPGAKMGEIPTGLNINDNHFSVTKQTADHTICPPQTSLSDMIKPAWALPPVGKLDEDIGHCLNLRVLMTGLMPSMSPPPQVIRMCPPLTTRNLKEYVPNLAVGTHTGSIQIFNIATGVLEREFALHTYPILGMEWTSLTSILSYGHQPLTNNQGLVRNELIHTNILTGRTITLRQNKNDESSIDGIRVSYLKQYFIVIFREDPFELWDAKKLVPLRTMPRKFPKVSAIEWSPTSHVKAQRESENNQILSDGTNQSASSLLNQSMTESTMSVIESLQAKETFVFTDTEGQLYHFSVEGNVIKDGTKVPPDSQMSTITSIAWKSHEIVLSDADGNLNVWDLKTRVSRHISTHRGWIRKIRFAPGRDNMKLLILFADGVDIWDVRNVVLVSQLKSPRDIVKICDIDWSASDRPILATMDGSLKVMDMMLKTSNSPITQYCSEDTIVSPYLLNAETSLNLRTLLTHQPWKEKYSLNFTSEDGFAEDQLELVKTWLSRIPSETKDFLINCDSTGHRAMIAAQLFGDRGEIEFWTIALHYLSQQSHTIQQAHVYASQVKDQCDSSVGSGELIDLGESAFEDLAVNEDFTPIPNPPPLPPLHPLETTYHHLCDATTYKQHELERFAIHESKNLDGDQRAKLGRSFAVIGERDHAVRLLLDADASNTLFYTDCLRACLLSATHHSPQAQSTIKLVATNLIAAGNVWEGVELLCLIGKAADACRYLQSYSFWESSVWLAKCALQPSEATDLLRRWAHHLITSGQKDYGVMALLSIGNTANAIEQLANQHYHQRAALLLDACQQCHALPAPQNVSATTAINSASSASGKNLTTKGSITSSTLISTQPSSPLLSSMTSLAACTENIQRKYILYLFSLGNRPAVTHFCNILGEKGNIMLQELDALS
ncbi:unnamed protein product [Meganyctiphanes norvegica]|uniref:WD repeat-containing protein 11 n=1 Tax=Meganyctiphanes norvegica TaxID=48144 RepID=A0AAV2SBF0_MEGNR